jgi:hypothetical protein
LIQVKINVRWGEKNLATGEPAEGAYSELEFTDEDMAGDQVQVWESLKITWTAIRGRYLFMTRGPKWYMKEG